MRSIRIWILVAMCILFISSIVTSLTIPSDNRPDVPDEVLDLFRPGTTTGGVAGTSGIRGAEGASSTGGGGGEKERPPIVLSEGDFVQIKKEIILPSDNGYLVGDTIGVYVEVLCKRNMNKVCIKEFAKNDIDILNISKYCYKLKTAEEIIEYEGRINKEYFEDIDSGNELKNGESKIHENDKFPIKLDGSICIFDKKNRFNYKDNLTKFLKEFLSIPFADNVNATLNTAEDILNLYNMSNSSQNISIYLDKKREHAILRFENTTYKFFVKCNDINCPSGESIPLSDDLCAISLLAKRIITNLSIYTIQKDFDIEINEPRANDRYVYWYYIKLDKPGNYEFSTIALTSYGNVRDIPDICISEKIRVSNPSPVVNIRLNKIHFLKNEEFNITYEIKYKCHNTINNIISVNFLNFTSYYSFLNKSSHDGIEHNFPIIPLGLDKKKGTNITRRLKYGDAGEYYLPVITINGEDFPFQNERVFVDTRFERYAQLVTLILGIIGFFMKDLIFPLRKSNEKDNGDPKSKQLSGNSSKPDQAVSDSDAMINAKKIILIILAIIFIIIVYWFMIDKPFLYYFP